MLEKLKNFLKVNLELQRISYSESLTIIKDVFHDFYFLF